MAAILYEDEGAVRIITLNRPEVRNALDLSLRRELDEALDKAHDDPAVRALVITGSGSAFCSGMDLAELESLLGQTASEHASDSRELAELFHRIYSYPKPVVAAVNGHAIAGGAGLASVCDLVIMSDEAKLGYTEARIGFVAALVSVFLSRMVGERSARELLLEARPVDAAWALQHGLVNAVVSPESVLSTAVERAQALARNSPMALSATKRLLAQTSGLPLAQALDMAAEVNAAARSTPDIQEGVRAFLEKRPPRWRIDDA